MIFGTPARVPGVSEKGESLAIDGKTLYCGAGGALSVFDVQEPLRPKLLTKVEGLAYLRQMQVENGWLVASSRRGGAWIVDVREPARAKVVSNFDTEDKAEKGPLSFRTNLMRTKTGCCVFQDRILIANTGSFILLDPAQDRNADGTPWPTFGYANSKMGPTGLPIWDGGTRVVLAANSRKEIQMANFSNSEKPKLLWTEKTVGYPRERRLRPRPAPCALRLSGAALRARNLNLVSYDTDCPDVFW